MKEYKEYKHYEIEGLINELAEQIPDFIGIDLDVNFDIDEGGYDNDYEDY